MYAQRAVLSTYSNFYILWYSKLTMSYEGYGFPDGDPGADYYSPQFSPFGEGLPRGMEPQEDILFKAGVADAIMRDQMMRAQSAQAYADSQEQTYSAPYTPAEPAAEPLATPQISSPRDWLEPGRSNQSSPFGPNSPYRRGRSPRYAEDTVAYTPEPQQEPEMPIAEERRGSYRKAFAVVAAVGGLVLGGITYANHDSNSSSPEPAVSAPVHHEAVPACQLTAAREINGNVAIIELQQPVDSSRYTVEVGTLNNAKEWVDHTAALPTADKKNAFAFTVRDDLEYNRLVAKVADHHGNATFCDGAFGLAPVNSGDAWFDGSQQN